MKHFLLLVIIVHKTLSIACPPYYTDGNDGSCYSSVRIYPFSKFFQFIGSPAAKIKADQYCGNDGAYLVDIQNAFQNTKLLSISYYDPLLGLVCTDSNATSCIWDNGKPIGPTSYANFFEGKPDITIGACAYLSRVNGLWYSTDCAVTSYSYQCKYTPGFEPLNCAPAFNFLGNCYFATPLTASSFGIFDAEGACRNQSATLVSIHNPGLNAFFTSLAQTATPYYLELSQPYMLTGLHHGESNYTWSDGSPVNYINFGFENVGLGGCVSVSLNNDIVNKGQWINSQCSTNDLNSVLAAVCQAKPIQTTTPQPTISPVECPGKTQMLSGNGTLSSPGYPRASLPNYCEYFISNDARDYVIIDFDQLSLDHQSYLYFYSGLFDTYPFQTLSGTFKPISIQSNTNMLRMVYNTSGTFQFGPSNYWNAYYTYQYVPNYSTVMYPEEP